MRRGAFGYFVVVTALGAACQVHSSPTPAPTLVVEGSVLRFETDTVKSASGLLWAFAVPVAIHGRTFQFFADHGSNATLITASTVDAIHVPHQFSGATRVDTLVRRPGYEPVRDTSAVLNITQGDSTFQYWGNFDPIEIDSLRIGPSLQDHVMIGMEVAAQAFGPFDGLFGRDILSQFDIEFNAASKRLRLYAHSTSDAAAKSPWLPADMRRVECTPATVLRHMSIDTTQLDSAERLELRTDPAARRMFDQTELQLPLTINDTRVDALFDSGMDVSIMNWAEAEALGIQRNDARLVRAGSGRMNMILVQPGKLGSADSLAAVRDSEPNFRVGGMAMRIGNRELPRDSVMISDLTFADYPHFRTQPIMLVGLNAFKDVALYLSYSTARVCIGDPSPF
ncbi:MAG TPA: hypothetical protein VGM82_17760 [Gemmatimonadaceae bacterium]|jgi:hypothetical protein